jgi:hypothetical protein
MDNKTKNIPIVKPDRTLSDEFKTQSPFTQQYIKCLVGGTTPTSNPKNWAAEPKQDFTAASPNTQTNIKFWLGLK